MAEQNSSILTVIALATIGLFIVALLMLGRVPDTVPAAPVPAANVQADLP